MNNETLDEIWEKVCNLIKSYPNIDSTQISAFFSRLQPQAISEGFFIATAENDFIRTWIERHYSTFIKKALEELYQVPFVVTVEIDISNSQEKDHTPPVEVISREDKFQNQQNITLEQSEIIPLKASTLPEKVDSLPPTKPTQENYQSLQPGTVYHGPFSTLTFENFIIGDSNRMAYSMAVSVAELPGKANLNPLFIYGKSGLGKTHLMRAIQNYIQVTLPHLSTVYVDSQEFLSDYMEAGAAHDKEKSSYKNFKTRYEDVDVLLIDDVQYFQGKTQTLNIVFEIFNKLTSQGKQVVLSADRAPKNIDIDERYKSRFNSGATFDIQPPEIETKLGIIKSFINEYRENEGSSEISISEEIELYIAENSSSNIRELKSAITKIIYNVVYFKQPNLTIQEVKNLLDNHFSGNPSKRLTILDIQKEIENFYKISHASLVGNSRTRNVNHARQVCIYLCRQLLVNATYTTIGKEFNRDHATVMYSVNRIEEQLRDNRELSEEIETLSKIIRDTK